MLLNLWDTPDPSCKPTDAAPGPWRRGVVQARGNALKGRYAQARQHLSTLRRLAREAGDDVVHAAVDLELARLPCGADDASPDVAVLGAFLDNWRNAARHEEPRWAALFAVAVSESELAEFRRRPRVGPHRRAVDTQRELAFNRARALPVLGRFHPAVGVLDLHLGIVSHLLRDEDSALEYLHEALACFRAPKCTWPERFTHERSDVLLRLAELAVDLGFLDQAESLLQRVLIWKGGPAGEEGAELIRPLAGESPVMDRVGLARTHGVLAELHQLQGQLYPALEAYANYFRLSTGKHAGGFFANRSGQILMEAGAYEMAHDIFAANFRSCLEGSGSPAPLNRVIASLNLAYCELVRTTPSGNQDVFHGPRQRQLRDESRARAESHFEDAGAQLDSLRRSQEERYGRGDLLAPWPEWLDALRDLLKAHRLLDAANLDEAAFTEVRNDLLEVADQFGSSNPTTELAGNLLWDLVRLELWAWRAHRYAPPGGDDPAFAQLLDLWERRGARHRLERLQRWAEEAGYGDVSRLLLNRYLPPDRGQAGRRPDQPWTVLFADISNSSGHARDPHAPEPISRLEAELFRAINPLIEDNGGKILRYQGDSILVVFNRDGADLRHAGQAVTCALAMQRAVRQLSDFRIAQVPSTLPLRLPIGIHSGTEVEVGHLMIPGRREFSVFGNTVNLAKRVQELGRSHPQDDVFVSKATLDLAGRGPFRTVPIVPQSGHYRDDPNPPETYALRAFLPCRTTFAAHGTPFRKTPDVLALEVGDRIEAGAVSHHQPDATMNTAMLVHQNPDYVRGTCSSHFSQLELVLHAGPDFGCCATAFLALAHLERHPETHHDDQRAGVLGALAAYANKIDQRLWDPDPDSLHGSLFALFLASTRQPSGMAGRPFLWKDRHRLTRGLRLLDEAVERRLNGPSEADFDRIFCDAVPPFCEEAAQKVRGDRDEFRTRDESRLQPIAPRGHRKQGLESLGCCLLEDGRSLFAEVWARRAGYDLVVRSSKLPALRGNKGKSVLLYRYAIGVTRAKGIGLADLGKQLEKREAERRIPLEQRELRWPGPRRGDFANADPWYDGRSPIHGHSIVSSPNLGSVLDPEDVAEVIRTWLSAPA